MGFCLLVGIVGLIEFYNAFEKIEVKASKPFGMVALAALYIVNLAGLSQLGGTLNRGFFCGFSL